METTDYKDLIGKANYSRADLNRIMLADNIKEVIQMVLYAMPSCIYMPPSKLREVIDFAKEYGWPIANIEKV